MIIHSLVFTRNQTSFHTLVSTIYRLDFAMKILTALKTKKIMFHSKKPTFNTHDPVCIQGDSGLVLTTDPKPRLRWTVELHARFVEAVTQLGGPDSTSLVPFQSLQSQSCFACSFLLLIQVFPLLFYVVVPYCCFVSLWHVEATPKTILKIMELRVLPFTILRVIFRCFLPSFSYFPLIYLTSLHFHFYCFLIWFLQLLCKRNSGLGDNHKKISMTSLLRTAGKVNNLPLLPISFLLFILLIQNINSLQLVTYIIDSFSVWLLKKCCWYKS